MELGIAKDPDGLLVGPRSSVSNIGPRAHSTLKIFVCVSWYKQRKAILFFRKAAYRLATCCKGVVCTYKWYQNALRRLHNHVETSEFPATWSCQCKPVQAESGCRAFARENPVSSVAPPTLASVGRHRGTSRAFETLEIGQNYIKLIASDTTVVRGRISRSQRRDFGAWGPRASTFPLGINFWYLRFNPI